MRMFLFIGILSFCFIIFISFIVFKYAKFDRAYFENRGIKSKTLSFDLAEKFDILFKRFAGSDYSIRTYNAFPNESIFGICRLNNRTYVVRDPILIKKMAIENFDHFEDHSASIDELSDKIWGNTLFSMKGEKWRQMRATLSPAFTGNKMRQMYELVSECSTDFVEHLKRHKTDRSRLNVEMKDLFTRYTNDVIASCAFGIKVDSMAKPNNDFYRNGKKQTNIAGFIFSLKCLLMLAMPKLARALNLHLTDTKMFQRIVLDTMDWRKKNEIFRPDMINTMIEIRNGSFGQKTENNTDADIEESFAAVQESEIGKKAVNRIWNDDEIVAQCFIFFLAGFETSSTVLTFAAYELVANTHIQQILYEEIAEVNKQLNGKRINYDTLMKMKYLDQFIAEVLRKWPPVLGLSQRCVKDYLLKYGDKLNFVIEKGTIVRFPLHGIHHDPAYYPNPERFDPDRFSDENRKNIIPGTYFPFGIGPRNCIGSRFALMEVKAILYDLLLNFSFKANGKTEIPLKLKKIPFTSGIENGMHLELKPRAK